MPGLNTRGLTYNLPNYHGPLTVVSPQETPFFSAIGGLQQGGDALADTQVEWQFTDLRAAAQNVALEGADAPTPNLRTRFSLNNVTEIHHEAVDVSYTKLAATQKYAGINTGGTDNPVLSELDTQVVLNLAQIKRDAEFSFIQGTYQSPSDNTTPRKTRGIIAATTTNVIAKTGSPAPTKSDIVDLLQMVWTNGGIQVDETATLMCNASLKRWLTKLFITDANYQEGSRTVGGVRVTTIETDFGTLNIMLNRYMPADTLEVVSLEECEPIYTVIPGKGVLFAEPLAKIGASDRVQIYGEIGLKYGNERKHGKITGFSTAAPTG